MPSENGAMKPEDVVIPEDALSESFLAATGPGGQNVNKVATAVQLRLDLFKLGLSPEVYERLKRIAGSKMTLAGELLVTARRFRSQDANRTDARARLAQMIADAHIVQAKRRPTRPSKAAKAKRIDKKTQRGAVKRTRGKVEFD
jgi:ribosome-associated protein